MMPAAPGNGESAKLLTARRRQLGIALVLLGVVVVALAAWFSAVQRREVEDEARVTVELYARVLEGQVSRIVGSTANTLDALAAIAPLADEALDAQLVSRLLAQQLPSKPYIRSVALLDDNGHVLASTSPRDVGRRIKLSQLGRVDDASLADHIGPLLPIRELADLEQPESTDGGAALSALPMLRRIELAGPAGRARWLAALLNTDYFSTQHALITAGSRVNALLTDLHGRVISSTGEAAVTPASTVSALAPFASFLPRREHASYVGAGSDGHAVIAAFRVSHQWPLVVIAEVPESLALADWRERSLNAAGVALAMLALLGALGWLADRGLRREVGALAEMQALHDEVARTEERWKLALEGAEHGVWDVDLRTGKATVSARLMMMLGHSEHDFEWTLESLRRALHPDDLAAVAELAQRHLRGETASFECETRVRALDGSWKWVLLRGRLAGEPGASGQGMRMIGTVTDVSERKAAEAALRASEARQQAILRSAMDGIVTVDDEQRIVMFNPAASRIFGWPVDEALGQPLSHLLPMRHREEHVHQMRAFGSSGESQRAMSRTAVVHGRRRNGEEFPLEASVSRLQVDGRDYFTAIVRDVTEQQRVQRELRQSEGRFRAVYEQAAVGILEQAQDRRFLRANPALCQLLGYTLEEFQALDASELIHPDDEAVGLDGMRKLFAGELRSFTQEKRYRRKDGGYVWIRLTASVVNEPEAGAQRLLGIVEDISARRQIEADLRDARQRELSVGARIQQSLLVQPPDQRVPGLWMSSFSQGSQGIDGDFVEMLSLGKHGVDMIVGDVMGKGVAAALMGAATKMQFSRCIAELMVRADGADEPPSPAQIVAAVHREMTPNLQSLEAFVTLSYVRLDVRAGIATWVGCGHEEPLLLRRDGEASLLANQHPPLGVIDSVEYRQDQVPFALGDALFLASDGAADALLPDGSRLGRERVGAIIEWLFRSLKTPAAVLHGLRRELARVEAQLNDDLTLAMAMRVSEDVRVSRRELPGGLADVVHVRGLVEHRSHEAGLDEVQASLFALACVEAYTNVVRHTQGGLPGSPVELVTRVEPDALVVDIVSLGEAFEPPTSPPDTSFDLYPEGGFGLTIMSKVADRVEYLNQQGVNTVRLTHWLEAPTQS